jgi:ribosomal protein S11
MDMELTTTTQEFFNKPTRLQKYKLKRREIPEPEMLKEKERSMAVPGWRNKQKLEASENSKKWIRSHKKYIRRKQGKYKKKSFETVSLSKTVSKIKRNTFALLNYVKTKNNCYCSISNLFGLHQTIWSLSTGMIAQGVTISKTRGFRKTRYAQNQMLQKAILKLKSLGCRFLVIHSSAHTMSRHYLFKNFNKLFKLLMIKDITGVAHNGCRAPLPRRV